MWTCQIQQRQNCPLGVQPHDLEGMGHGHGELCTLQSPAPPH